VCAFDETSGSRNAASIAARLARDLHSRAVLVYISEPLGLLRLMPPRGIHPPVPVAPGPSIDEGLADAANEALVGALERAGVSASAHIVPLPAARALEEVAEKQRARLIVVGSRGRGKLGSLLHGWVAMALAAEGRTAVVVLPLGTRLEPGSGHYELAAGLG
jgi:nucleotide-binding universal stress UspA family protein